VYLVDGSYDQAFDLSVQASAEFGWYCRNTGYNPFTAEGKKTAAYEICEQFTRAQGRDREDKGVWDTPEAVFVSVGDGNIISGLHKGFKDLLSLGWIKRMPRLFGVQARGSAAIYRAFSAGSEQISPVEAETLADSISVNLPRDGLRALRAAAETSGAYLAVSDEEILAAMLDLGQQAGVFAEPAGAAAYAGARKAISAGQVHPQVHLLVLNTGSGLKDIPAAMQAAGEAQVIQPDLASLQAAVAETG
jgi:threonine synthase